MCVLKGDTGISFSSFSVYCGSHTHFSLSFQVVIRSRLDQSMEEAQELKVKHLFSFLTVNMLFSFFARNKMHTFLITERKNCTFINI